MTAAPSRAVLSRWASELLNEPIGTAPEKKCTNGVIYCKLLEAVRPGTLNLTKVNVSADAEHSSLANYRILAAGLEKAGVTVNIDAGTLSKGQPAATLDLLHRLFALANPQAPPQKGLAPLDANALPAYVQPTYAEPIACVLHEANSLNFVTARINLCLGFSIILLDLLVTIAE